MTLETIFKTNPDLLNEPEVKNLIEHVQSQHKRMVSITTEFKSFHDFVLGKCMYSELILINGKDSKETLTEILKEINDI